MDPQINSRSNIRYINPTNSVNFDAVLSAEQLKYNKKAKLPKHHNYYTINLMQKSLHSYYHSATQANSLTIPAK